MSSSTWGVSCQQLQQGRYAAIFLTFLALFAASGCAERPVGEFTAEDCSDLDDNDRDSLTDCDDPDCWVFCPFRGDTQLGDASSSMASDAEPDATKPAADSGKPTGIIEEDAGTLPIDAGADDDAGAACDCAPDESCVDGMCKPSASTSIEGMYTLRVKSALVPIGPSTTTCFDYENVGCSIRLLGICECEPPDTYVVVMLNGTVLMNATTTPVRNTTNPIWADSPTVKIELKPTDRLTFLAFDSDGIGQDPQIFMCMPALSDLEGGNDTLACNPKAGTTVTPAGSKYIITVEVKKIAPDASMP
jgi:hypothetical protein